MKPAEALSEAVMDVLKEFSQKRLPLHCASLREIFAAREEIVSLLASDVETNIKERQPSAACGESGHALPRAEVNSKEWELEQLPDLREAFLAVLEGIAPAIKGDHEGRFTQLQEEICGCQSLKLLSSFGTQVGTIVGELIQQAVKDTDYSNDFLFELSKDLYQMEQQLSTYQDFNKEGYKISNEFYTDILSSTTDINHAIGPNTNESGLRGLIHSKLIMISESIDLKRKSDERRASESEIKINELQNDLKAHERELLQIRKRSESLEKDVFIDELTKISNRRSYDLHIKECLREYKRSAKQFSLILIDIDHFKIINDSYGHKAGDKCLKEIAQRIKSTLRKSDFLARYGGEELVVILHECDAKNAVNVAENIRRRIENTRFYYHDETIPVTVSLGVTEVMSSDSEPEAPFVRVDEAMYRAKNEGRNRVCSTSAQFAITSRSSV
ncbi:MAG: GGDEF domain-containing protein [Syntrophobacteraceae bacterium]|nr:GGDEF domain-containing protein [Syntrophobacteraceae bacterium]